MFQFFRELQLVDTYAGLIILYTSMHLPFTLIIFINFLLKLPSSLEEAAMVDGAGIVNIVKSIIIPLLSPAIATMGIINFISGMDQFMYPFIFTNNKILTLSTAIITVPRVDQYDVPWHLISALATVMLIPIILFVTIFERKIMEGIMAGGVKE
jgi:ABC-type glycerol-3-phosphate transport system permease component